MPVHLVFGPHSVENIGEFKHKLAKATHVVLERDASFDVAEALAANSHATKASVLRDLNEVAEFVGRVAPQELLRLIKEVSDSNDLTRIAIDQEKAILTAVAEENLRRLKEGRAAVQLHYEPVSDNFNRDWETGVSLKKFSDAVAKENSFDALLENFAGAMRGQMRHFEKREQTTSRFLTQLDSPSNHVLMAPGSLHFPLIEALRKKGVKVEVNKRFMDPLLDLYLAKALRANAPVSQELAARAMMFNLGSHEIMRSRAVWREAHLKLSRFLEGKSIDELRELFNSARMQKQDLPKAVAAAAGIEGIK